MWGMGQGAGEGQGSPGHGAGSLQELLRALEPLYAPAGPACPARPAPPVDVAFLTELESLSNRYDLQVFVNRQFDEVKAVLLDDMDREHDLIIKRKKSNQYVISSTSLPRAAYQDVTYSSLKAAVDAFGSTVTSLKDYFRELGRIDALCWVVDPARPTYKDDYRRILLDERAWLHLEVGMDGSAGRMRILGGGESAARWNQKLTDKLASWDPAADIVENLMCILDIEEFPQAPPPETTDGEPTPPECNICLCSELPTKHMPQPLCSNGNCASLYHTVCLYEWLVASSGGAVPKFGVATGKCPNCLAPICCAENYT